jgi:hypothetical protein
MTRKSPLLRHFARAGGLVALWMCAVGCSDRVSAPPANTAISNVAGSVAAPFSVQCNGPADEVALLAGLCGSDTTAVEWMVTDAPGGMGAVIGPSGGALFLLYARADHDPAVDANFAGQAQYAGFVFLGQRTGPHAGTLDTWKAGEPVSSGKVVTQEASLMACSTDWIGQGTFNWRHTTVSFAWSAAEPC